MSVYHMYAVPTEARRKQSSLGIELHVINSHVGPGNQIQVL